jgi:RNA polymerase sigma-70 factor (ECF subfamily)
MNSVRYIVTEESAARHVSEVKSYEDDRVRRLVARAASGNIEAYGELYGIYLDRIYRYVFHQVGNRTTAEDLTEEIFIKAWKGIGKFKEKELQFSAWLYRIAHNHVIDCFRTSRQHLSLEAELLADNNPEQEVEEKEIQQLLLEAISCLPQQQKQLIILKFIEGLDNQEIEQVMHKGQGAIRVMQMRALATLRQRLAGEIDDAG